MLTKRCSDCKLDKPVEMFNRDKSRNDGWAYRCKACSSARSGKRYTAKREEILEKSKRRYVANKPARAAKIAEWQAANQSRVKANRKRYKAENRERLAEADRAWCKANRDKRNATLALRRAALIKATPPWADHDAIRAVYALAKRREVLLGGRWSVDHIVPLRGKTVCGLHVEHNLQVIPLNENKAKGNRHWPESPQ